LKSYIKIRKKSFWVQVKGGKISNCCAECSPTYELDEVQESDRKDAATRQRNVVEAAGQEMAAASPQLHQASWFYRQRGDI
jgi:hypothetical protein